PWGLAGIGGDHIHNANDLHQIITPETDKSLVASAKVTSIRKLGLPSSTLKLVSYGRSTGNDQRRRLPTRI
ncbi:MAG: hypothetical protein WBE50_07725, partial [Methyloceanibacter sp.]